MTPESLSREGSPVPEYVDSATASPLNPLNTAAQYDINTTSAPPSPPQQHQGKVKNRNCVWLKLSLKFVSMKSLALLCYTEKIWCG